MTPRPRYNGIKDFIIASICLLMGPFLMAQEYPENAKSVYLSILRLENENVHQRLKEWKDHPVAQAHFENYMLFFELFIHEKEELYEKYYPKKDELLTSILEKGDPSSPYFLYAQADIYLQWALIESKFRDFFYAFRDVKKAYSLLEENHRRFPDFIPNKKNLGVMIALVGTIPDKYQWGVEWVSGISGNVELGQRWLAESAETDHLFQDEAIAMYGFFLIHVLGKEELGWDKINEINLPACESPLATFLLSNLALDLKKLEVAENILKDYEQGPQNLALPQLNYYRGLLYTYKGRFKEATSYFEEFLEEFKGIHLVKSALLHKAYGHYIMGEREKCLESLNLCRSEGDDLLDEDAYALSVAEGGELLPIPVLKVKLFFDGGNYQSARELIKETRARLSDEKHQKILRYYQARIDHETGSFADAIRNYRQVMHLPYPEFGHYAANSALQIGNILKEKGKCDEAEDYYKFCIALKAESFDNSLDQKAKAGLLQCR